VQGLHIFQKGSGYGGIAYLVERSQFGFVGASFLFVDDPACTGPIFNPVANSFVVDFYGQFTFSGTCTGQQYVAQEYSFISLPGGQGGVTVLPGNVAGTLDNTSSFNGVWGSASGTPSLTLGPNDSVTIGNGAIATTATDGFLYIPTCAGTPTGTPTAQAGEVALIYDTTNHQFWIYDGAWKQPKTPAGAATVTWQ
jgi:hypothetical protein